jgi:hypothetical protein
MFDVQVCSGAGRFWWLCQPLFARCMCVRLIVYAIGVQVQHDATNYDIRVL